MANLPVYVVDIMKAAAAATNAALRADVDSYLATTNKNINFQYGDKDEITKQMQLLTQGTTSKNTKYPFIGLVMPFTEKRGVEFYADVTFPRIIIATVTGADEDFNKRYESYFKPVLYPIYYELLNQLMRVPGIVISIADPDHIDHTKMDVPKIIPKESGLNDHVDAIVISNMRLTFRAAQIC